MQMFRALRFVLRPSIVLLLGASLAHQALGQAPGHAGHGAGAGTPAAGEQARDIILAQARELPSCARGLRETAAGAGAQSASSSGPSGAKAGATWAASASARVAGCQRGALSLSMIAARTPS